FLKHRSDVRDQVQIRNRDDRLRSVHVADHVRTSSCQLLQIYYILQVFPTNCCSTVDAFGLS
ncbi:hypothetical protein ACI65C_005227, partial [Semiaphis heraclei]